MHQHQDAEPARPDSKRQDRSGFNRTRACSAVIWQGAADGELVERLTASVAQRLVATARLNPLSECWEWIGPVVATKGRRYPSFRGLGEQFGHRVAYRLWRGEIPPGHYVRQQCDGVLCINPFHLLAIAREQAVRGWTAGRLRNPQTHCRRGHAFTADNTTWNSSTVRRAGGSVRVRTRLCRLCDRDRHRRPPLPKAPCERALEQSIRRVENAKLADRPRVLERELKWTAPVGVPAAPDEPWDSYRQRTGDIAHVDVWVSSRLIQHGRIREALAECLPACRQ